MIMMSRTLVSQSQYGLAGLLRSQLPFGFSFYLLSAPPSFFSGEHMGEDGDDDDRLASGLLSCLLFAVPSSTLVSTWVMEVQYKTCCCTFLLPIFHLPPSLPTGLQSVCLQASVEARRASPTSSAALLLPGFPSTIAGAQKPPHRSVQQQVC